jgi:hypothetical protein
VRGLQRGPLTVEFGRLEYHARGVMGAALAAGGAWLAGGRAALVADKVADAVARCQELLEHARRLQTALRQRARSDPKPIDAC